MKRPLTSRRGWLFATLLAAGVFAPSPAAAHGVGGRTDLPLPLWLFTWGATAALLVSFLVLALWWPSPRLARAAGGVPLPDWAQVGLGAVGFALRAVGVAGFGLVITTALWGRDDAALNLAPVVVYVVFWVGLQVLSAGLGDIWRVLSPYETVAAWVARWRAGHPRRWTDPGQWTAAAGLFSFVWLELAYYESSSPRAIGGWIVAYSAAVAAGVALWGRGWLRAGEGFAGLFGLLGHLAPFFREDGTSKLRVRWPTTGLATVTPRRGTWALLFVALGSTTFDGFSRTEAWVDVSGNRTGWSLTLANTVGLVASIVVMALAFRIATRAAARIGERDPLEVRDLFLGSLIPITLGYTVAHYFSLFLFEGQAAIALASDPFGQGWDLFGTASRTIDYRLVSTNTIAFVQVGAIVAGHVVGVMAAHDRAVELWDAKVAVRTQYPMLAVMVLYTVGGLAVLLGG